MVLKIVWFCPKQFKTGQKGYSGYSPDFKSKFLITALIILPMQITLFPFKKYKGMVTYKTLDF